MELFGERVPIDYLVENIPRNYKSITNAHFTAETPTKSDRELEAFWKYLIAFSDSLNPRRYRHFSEVKSLSAIYGQEGQNPEPYTFSDVPKFSFYDEEIELIVPAYRSMRQNWTFEEASIEFIAEIRRREDARNLVGIISKAFMDVTKTSGNHPVILTAEGIPEIMSVSNYEQLKRFKIHYFDILRKGGIILTRSAEREEAYKLYIDYAVSYLSRRAGLSSSKFLEYEDPIKKALRAEIPDIKASRRVNLRTDFDNERFMGLVMKALMDEAKED